MIVALLTAGCASAKAAPPAPQLPPAGPATEITLPLDSYTPSPQEQERTDRAQAILERACLRRFGIAWSGPGEDDLITGKAMLAAARAGRFGLVDRAQATRYGYHQPPWSVSALAAGQERDGADDPPPEVAKVLFGGATTVKGRPVPHDGCRGEAARQLAAGTGESADPTLVTQLREDANRRALADSRVDRLIQRWSACLTRAGYHYSTPAAAARDSHWERGKTPTRAEIATATADVGCKNEASYLATMASVTTEYQAALIRSHTGPLAALRRSMTTKVANADRVLAGRSPAPSPTA